MRYRFDISFNEGANPISILTYLYNDLCLNIDAYKINDNRNDIDCTISPRYGSKLQKNDFEIMDVDLKRMGVSGFKVFSEIEVYSS